MNDQPPYLTDGEISAMCEPLKQSAAQLRYLEGLGLLVAKKPNGRPMVLRSELDRVLGAGRFGQVTQASPHAGPNVMALRDHLSKRRHHGASA
ncbi:MAG: hypothetical protein I8H71_15570 [Xanthomonadaceae bacterium]|nr:hypothetical protein [Xanthomonadaceae bacterium]